MTGPRRNSPKARPLDFSTPYRSPDAGVRVDIKGSVTITWGGYEYVIPADRAATPERLLGWIVHIGYKRWDGMEPWKIGRLVEKVAARRRWDIWGETK